MATTQKPTVGRIVHFLTDEGETLPGIITRVNNDGMVNLRVFTNQEHGSGAMLLTNVKQGKKERQWSLPAKDGD